MIARKRFTYRSSVRVGSVCLAAALGVSGVASAHPAPASASSALTVSTIASGLDHPWDVVVAPDGVTLTDERAGTFVAVMPDGSRRDLAADLSNLFVQKEAGLMGVALAPDFATSRRVYSCQAEVDGTSGSVGSSQPHIPDSIANLPVPLPSTGQVIKVVSWRVNDSWTALSRERTVLSGIPLRTSGRHAGCGLAAGADSTLWIGTGDNAVPTMPQDRTQWGGKVLHIKLDGTPAAGNPFPGSPIYTLGHRNVQGVALGPQGRVYSIEQGTSVDDELNLLAAGANYGYRPDRAPLIYDESVPMTDPVRVPGAVGPVWRSGDPTLATPALQFLPDSGWGQWNGAVVISAQKAEELVFVKFSSDGRSVAKTMTALSGQHGRLRGLAVATDGSLLVSTDNGGGTDQILRVRPALGWE